MYTCTYCWFEIVLFTLGDDVFLTNSLRCLAILLTTSKMKKHEGDIPHLMKFVPVTIYLCVDK